MNKILLANNYFYFRGGSERYLFRLTNLLKNRGHDVVSFSTKDERNWESPYMDCFADPFHPEAVKGLSFAGTIGTGCRVLYSLKSKKMLSKLLGRTRPDLAHCHNIYGALSPSILGVFNKNSIPVVMTVHDFKLMCPNHRMYVKSAVCERCKKWKFYECSLNKCIADSWGASVLGSVELYLHTLLGLYRRHIGAYIAPSEFMRQKLIAYGFPGERIFQIHSFIDAKSVVPNYDHGNYALYVGRIEEAKGIGTLLKAARELKDRMDFAVVGSGPMEAKLGGMISDANLSNVKYLGRVSDEKLASLLRDAMFVVVPSEWYENNPYVILEAYAAGKAVVASASGGIPEIIDDGKTGFLFRPSDATDLAAKIKTILGEGSLAAELGRNAREKVVRDFAADGHYEKILSVYRKVL